VTILEESLFNYHERTNVSLKGKKQTSDRTRGDGRELDVQTQLKEYTREVFAK